MAILDHGILLGAFQSKFHEAKAVLDEIAANISKTKTNQVQDLLTQVNELLQRVHSATTPRKLEVEVARAVARDCETIASRWRELEQYFDEEIHYDDYLYSSEEERAHQALRAQQTIRLQILEALTVAGAMYSISQEWRLAALCFNTVAQGRQGMKSPLAPLSAMIREYRCYEELGDLRTVLQLGKSIRKVLSSVGESVSSEERSVLQDAAGLFRKTAMSAITNRKKQPDPNIPIGAVYLWCEAEAWALAAEISDATPQTKFKALAEFFEQIKDEELASKSPSLIRIASSYLEGIFAYLRISQDMKDFSVQQAKEKSAALQRQTADFLAQLLERLGYLQVTIVEDPTRAMKGLLALMNRVIRAYNGSTEFNELAQQAGEVLVWAIQRNDQEIRDVATTFRWLFEGVGLGLEAICLRLISDIYRVGIFGDIIELGSKEELRQSVYRLLNIEDDDDIFSDLLEAEIEFDDVVDLFRSMDLFWIAALCKENQGKLRQNISLLEMSLIGATRTPDVAPASGADEVVESPHWGAAPSRDFTNAADLYSQAFRWQRGTQDNFEAENTKTWMPFRDANDLRRRAANSLWLAGLAYLKEGNVAQGKEELIRAKDAYELLGRYREADSCLQVLGEHLIVDISQEGEMETRPTLERLRELLDIFDELVGLYKLRTAPEKAIKDILGTVQFLQTNVGMENWTLEVFLRAIEYTREALQIAHQNSFPTESAFEMFHILREELYMLLDNDFAIGAFPNFEPEVTVYFETETPIKLAILNVSDKERGNLTIRPIGILPHLSPSKTKPWRAARDPAQLSMKHFFVGADDEAYEINDQAMKGKPADAFGPPRLHLTPISEPQSKAKRAAMPPDETEPEQELLTDVEQPWLGIMWTGDASGFSIGRLSGATETPGEEAYPLQSIDDLTTFAFFTVFTKAAREGNILPGHVFPVTFGIFEEDSSTPIASQIIFLKIASRPKILQAETNWATDIGDSWEETFSIQFEEGAFLPRYVPRFAPEYEPKDYVNPTSLTPTITMGQDAVELTKHLKNVPKRFTLQYHGKKSQGVGRHFSVKNTISLKMPMSGPIGGEYEFLHIELPSRPMSSEELAIPRLRNGVNFQELFYGTVFIGDAKYDGEYFIYRLWYCFEPFERDPAPGATYRQGWTNHRLDIFLDPKTWQPQLIVTDYYVKGENGEGEWIEALYSFKAASSTLFGIRRITAKLHRQVAPSILHKQLEQELEHVFSLSPGDTASLNITGFQLGQRLGFIDLIRISRALDKRDGPVTYKPPRAHLFRDYWSQRYEHGLYREDWQGSSTENQFEMRELDRTGGKSKYVSELGQRLIPHEVSILPRGRDRCDLIIQTPGKEVEPVILRNIVNPRKIELWTRPHVSFSRRFNILARHFGRPPKIHTASLYLYSIRKELNPYYKTSLRGKDQWIRFPEALYWTGSKWKSFPHQLQEKLPQENLASSINSWLEADTYWVYRYVWFWPLEWTIPLPHEDWERADIWVNARTGNIEWITSDYHWRELWYEASAKISGVNPIIDFLFNWNTPEPLTVKDGAQVHQSIIPYFGEGEKIGEFADQLPWMFARYRHSCEHLDHLHSSFWGRHKVKIIYGVLILFIVFLILWFTPLGQSLLHLFFP